MTRKPRLAAPVPDHPPNADSCVQATPGAGGGEPLYVTVDEMARLLRVSRTTAWKYVKTGVVPSIRLSPRVVRVPLAALRDLAAGPPNGNDAAPGASLARPCASEYPGRPGCGGSAR
jgi:excisionase family DNA binding protein